MNPSRILAGALVLAAAGSLLRMDLAHQPSDPPRDLSVSIGTLDEGIWSHNAVNSALFGRARLDDFNPMYVTAGSWFYRASYALFGVGIRQTRFPSIALAALTVLLIGFGWMRRSPLAGAAGAVLLGTTYLYTAYSRLGLLEMPAAALAVAGLIAVIAAVERGRATIVLGAIGGALLAAGIAVKIQTAAPIVGAVAGLIAFQIIGRTPRGRRALTAALAGFVILGAAWATFVLSHLDPVVRSEWAWHSSGVAPRLTDVPSNILKYIRNSDGFGTHARPLLLAAAAGALVQAAGWAAGRFRPGALELASFGWAVGAIGIVASLPYTPSRYAVLALPGLALTAAGGIAALSSMVSSRAKTLIGASAAAGVAAAALFGIASWVSWARHPEFSLRRTAALLARETRPGDTILGGWALLASIDAHRQVIVEHVPNINDRCPIERYGVDWVVARARDPGERAFVRRQYPDLLQPANMVATATVLGRELTLYRVAPGVKGVGCTSSSGLR